MSKPRNQSYSKLYVTPGLCCTHHFWSFPPSLSCLLHTKARIHTHAHAMGKEHRRPFLLSQPMNPNLSYKNRSNPKTEVSATQVTASLRGMCRRSSRAAIHSKPSQAQRFGTQRFFTTFQADTPTRLGLSPAWEGSTCCSLRLLQPTTNTSSGSSCRIWVPSKRGHSANLAMCFRSKQTKEARTLLPFKPATLSRSIHRPSGAMGKEDSAGCSLPLHCHLPSSQACIWAIQSPCDATKSTSETPVVILWCPLTC